MMRNSTEPVIVFRTMSVHSWAGDESGGVELANLCLPLLYAFLRRQWEEQDHSFRAFWGKSGWRGALFSVWSSSRLRVQAGGALLAPGGSLSSRPPHFLSGNTQSHPGKPWRKSLKTLSGWDHLQPRAFSWCAQGLMTPAHTGLKHFLCGASMSQRRGNWKAMETDGWLCPASQSSVGSLFLLCDCLTLDTFSSPKEGSA